MDKIKKVNSMIAKKQLGRLIGGIGAGITSLILLGNYIYQKGITREQIELSKDFPEEYAAITEKIIKSWENK